MSTVLITGASAGIGAACARAFAAYGARLVLAARRVERLEQLASDLERDHGTRSHLISIDVRDAEGVASTLGALPHPWSEVDVLVNNAGLGRGVDRVHEGNPEEWDEMIDTNVKGVLYVSRAVLPGMVKRARGHVINLGSVAGHEVYPGGAVYCSTKHALDAITREHRRSRHGGNRVQRGALPG
jgi:serine 3-dehydrogenase